MNNKFGIENNCLLVIDVQGRLANLMHKKKSLFKHIRIMIKAAKILNIKIYWFEQYPKGLGPTIEVLKDLLVDTNYYEKITFSACGEAKFIDQLKTNDTKQCIVTGIETHVCVYQTVVDLLSKNFKVKVNQDAVSSRVKSNKKLGLKNMEKAGAQITSTEMILFELMQSANFSRFKDISALLK
ncbi:MAG: hydrolase [Marinicellaceae bacterium]